MGPLLRGKEPSPLGATYDTGKSPSVRESEKITRDLVDEDKLASVSTNQKTRDETGERRSLKC